MRVTPLASGSLGNATLVEAAGIRVLVDAGLAAAEIDRRLAAVTGDTRGVDVIVLTHRHGDHIRGARDICLGHKARVVATRRTAKSLGTECRRRIVELRPAMPLDVADLAPSRGRRRAPRGRLVVRAFVVPHDAPETVALTFDAHDLDGTCRGRHGHVTDLGHVPDGLAAFLADCTSLLLEFNYDEDRLVAGDDPPFLKRRIASDTGHLGNRDAAALLAAIAHPGLLHVWPAHVSRRNNSPELARTAAATALAGRPGVAIHVAEQHEPSMSFDASTPSPAGGVA